MDRVISLLAALVGLIALGGAILVHTNGDAQRNQMAAEIAQLKLSVGLITQQQRPAAGSQPAISSTEMVPSAAEAPSSAAVIEPAPSSEVPIVTVASSGEPPSELQLPPSLAASSSQEAIPAVTTDMTALLARIAQLEKTTQDQASQLEEARSKLSALPSGEAAAQVAASSPSSSAMPAALAVDGPTTDCIPLGTRFMGTTGDKFPICKTKLVVKVAAVTDGLATIAGPGDIAPGAFGALDKGCSVMVFSADTSGYAEMRVTCP